MRAKTHVFIATSRDGFIARREDGMDWLDAANATMTPGEDCGFAAFMAGVDAMVMGRTSFEKVMNFNDWPYGAIPVTVLSRTLISVPKGAPPTVSVSRKTPSVLITELSERGATNVYIDGGVTIQSFLAAGLVDEITITTIPVLIGGGKPLFGALSSDVKFELVYSKSYLFGFVQSRYKRLN